MNLLQVGQVGSLHPSKHTWCEACPQDVLQSQFPLIQMEQTYSAGLFTTGEVLYGEAVYGEEVL